MTAHHESKLKAYSSITTFYKEKCKELAPSAVDSKKHHVCNKGNNSVGTTKEFTDKMNQRITFLLNCIYADEFAEDVFLLEFIIILFTRKEGLELQENAERIEDNDEEIELQEWMNIMSQKIHGGDSSDGADVTHQTRIPGPVGRPVIGGCMSEWIHEKNITGYTLG